MLEGAGSAAGGEVTTLASLGFSSSSSLRSWLGSSTQLVNVPQAVILSAVLDGQDGVAEEVAAAVGDQVGDQVGGLIMILHRRILGQSRRPVRRQGGGQASGVDLQVVRQLPTWLAEGGTTMIDEAAVDPAAIMLPLQGRVHSLQDLGTRAQGLGRPHADKREEA